MLILVNVAVLLGIASASVAHKAVEPEVLDALLREGRYEEFSYHLGIPHPNLVRASNERSVGLDPRFHKELKEGDMIVPDSKETARQAIDLFWYTGSRWPSEDGTAIVPVAISNEFSDTEREAIHKGLIYWNEMITNVKIVYRSDEVDYILFFKGDGCWSHMTKRGYQQPLSLGEGCLTNGTIVHELAHACGIVHEQNRYDRDNYLVIKWENIPADWKNQYEKNNERDYIILGDYDCYSIMHYPYLAPDTTLPAFEFKQSGCDVNLVGIGDTFTEGDVEKLNKLYTN